jgi:hypothetical protein
VAAAVGGSGRRVIVVAHSLGGLVARYWIGPGDGWRHCRALLTMGTPHRGAPRAVDWLYNGVGAGSVRLPGPTRVLRQWPSVYELLPQYPAVQRAPDDEIEPTSLDAELVRTWKDPAAAAQVLRHVHDAAKVHHDIAAGWAGIPAGRAPTAAISNACRASC